jgi:transcription initiation factor TFIIIB Brf1 subunit/transcription initiation factor TFIIB
VLPGAWSRAVSRRSAALALVVAAAPAPEEAAERVEARRYPGVAGCLDDGPPGAACTRTECRYHLAHRGYWEHRLKPTRDCSLDVANEGPRTLDEVAEVLGVSGERVRQIEEEAIEHLKHNATLKELYDESPE